MKYLLLLCLVSFFCSCGSSKTEKVDLEAFRRHIEDSIKTAENTRIDEQNNESQTVVTIPNKANKKKKSDWRKDISMTYRVSQKTFKRDKIYIDLRNNSQHQNYAYIQVQVDFINSKGYVFNQRDRTFDITLLTGKEQRVTFETELPNGTRKMDVRLIDAREYNLN